MPEVIRGSRASIDQGREPRGLTALPTSPSSPSEPRNVHFSPDSYGLEESVSRPRLDHVESTESGGSRSRGRARRSSDRGGRHTSSEPPKNRPEAQAYYDSRAATKKEFKRRASTLQEYYKLNPSLLPQLPFTWRHGWKRYKLFGLIFLMFVDACVIPIVLYYAMKFAGHVQGYIIFAVVATIWGGPTYVEFGVRSWRLIKKENFFRPMGTTSRWAFDISHWIFTLTIASVTAFLVIGSAPHIVWLRILSLPGPAILICMGGCVFVITMYHMAHKPAPFRISSTPKGGVVNPGIFYLVEDVVAVNANAGRPYREALHARYEASPRFRRMMLVQSLFWSIPALIIGIVLVILICIHQVNKEVAYGLGWAVPFVWAAVWGLITVIWAKRDMVREREAWESDQGIVPKDAMSKILTPQESNRDRASDSERTEIERDPEA